MKDVLILRELEQIKAISQPYRIEILKCFEEDQPATAKQISDKMNDPHAKVNYHIKVLQKAGILELIYENIRLGIVEKYYLPSARTFIIDKAIHSCRIDKSEDCSHLNLDSDFHDIVLKFYDMLKKNPYQSINYDFCFLTDTEIKELMEILKNVIEKFIWNKKAQVNPDSNRYAIVAMLVPQQKHLDIDNKSAKKDNNT